MMKHIPRRILSVLLLFGLFLSGCTMIQPPTPANGGGTVPELPLTAPLPADPNVRMGQLDNGLTYFIRHNSRPVNRAELRLVINAGSLLEDEDQVGLAHFLEHMLFNGTRQFPNNELIDFLGLIGMEFGPDLNAYTSFDETVYQLYVPTDQPEHFDKAFDVLEDWAAYATLDPEEVEKERQVVVEEWRLWEANADGRINEQLWPQIFGDSQYTDRMPIGDMEIIRTASVEALRRFYQDWYRPDLMAVIAVGDFDVDAVEEKIRAHFSNLPVPEAPRPRATFEVPEHAEPRYLVLSDPEQSYTLLEVLIKRPANPSHTVADFRNDLITSLFYQMFNQRLNQLRLQEEPPFVYAGAGAGEFIRPLEVTNYYAQVQDTGLINGLTALVTEIERVQQHGFTESELERASKIILRSLEQAYKERNNQYSIDFVYGLQQQFLVGTVDVPIETRYQLAQQLLPAITLAEVNRLVAEMVAEENRVVFAIAPERADLVLPTEDELAAVYAAVAAGSLEPYVDQVVDEPLVAVVPEPIEIVSEAYYEELDVSEIRLANGIRILMKPTEFQADEILFSASSPGGLSLLPDEEYVAGWLIPEVVVQSGVGPFTQTELDNLLAGQQAYVSPYIGKLYEGFSGGSSADDLETLFQLIYLYATAARADTAAFAAVENDWLDWLENRLLDPTNVFYDAVNRAIHGEHLRYRWPTVTEIRSLDRARAMAIYQERFADMDDFTFVFVGNFEVEAMQALAQRYLGALPGLPTNETWLDLSSTLPTTIVEETVYKGQAEQSTVYIAFTGPADASEEHQARLDQLRQLLDLQVTRTLREEMGGIYGAYVDGYMSVEPSGEYMFSIEFTCDPARVDELVAAFFALVEELQGVPPMTSDIEAIQQQILVNQEDSLEDNQWWVDQIDYFATVSDRDLTMLVAQVEAEQAGEDISAEEMQATALEYLPVDRYIKVVLYPEAYQE